MVYWGCVDVRTNIDLDNDLIQRAMEVSGAKTKRAAVEQALRLMLRLKAQEGARQLRGTVEWEGALNTMRERRAFGFSADES